MSNPLIILGAGASYDFLNRGNYPKSDTELDDWQPPLANKIFDGTKFNSILDKYPETDSIVGYILGRISNSSLEEVMTKLFIEQIVNNQSLYNSFASLLFYLSDLFGVITKKYYRHRNNYDTLKHIISNNGNKATFVNFNYDLLLERSLGIDKVEKIDDFIAGELPVIKIHGAYNWFVRRRVNAFGESKKNSYDLSITAGQYIFNPEPDNQSKWDLIINEANDPKRISSIPIDFASAYSMHPALALPLQNKDRFVCPSSHIDLLKRKLTEVDRIIIIGWKIGDAMLKSLLIDELKKRSLPIAFVGVEDSQSIIDGQDNYLKSNIKLTYTKGFSNFVASNEIEEFLK